MMNPLTVVKRIQNINAKEAALGISDKASWHAKYKDSAYVYAGGISFDLSEGDILAVFAQYGEIVDCNLVRDKGTGKSKGFAFVVYEDQTCSRELQTQVGVMRKIGDQDGLMTSLRENNMLTRKGVDLVTKTRVSRAKIVNMDPERHCEDGELVQEMGCQGTTRRDWNRKKKM
ncbi:hypothetical protein ACH5RR_010195 [Cinchona calisaya]|uniref:RRM domain-containing protein n=1 Tax=Cinchona calisaya TaxID=153742 RepID=A0ABD3AHN2_9GENT